MIELDNNSTVLVFPGQGSQKVGMGHSFMDSEIGRSMIQKSEDILKSNISEIMFSGPQEKLNITNNAQLALFIAGNVACEYLKSEQNKSIDQIAKFVAGHSLGEYTALSQAGVFSFEDGLRLVSKRAEYMLESTIQNPGKMAAVLGLGKEDVLELTKATGTFLANDNTIGQVVISGSAENIQKAMDVAKEFGAKRIVDLPVSGAFHSSLMSSAAEKMAKEIDSIEILAPKVPVIMNVTGAAVSDLEEMKNNLKQQMLGSVKWLDTMEFIKSEQVQNIVELGSGRVLCGLFGKFSKDFSLHSLTQIEDFNK